MDPQQYHSHCHVWPTHDGHAATGTWDEEGITRPVQRDQQSATMLPIYTQLTSPSLPPPSLPQHHHLHHQQPQQQLPLPLPLYQYSEYPGALSLQQQHQNQPLGPVASPSYNCQRTPPPDYHNRLYPPAASIAGSRSQSHNRHHNPNHTGGITASSQSAACSTRSPLHHLHARLQENSLMSHMDMDKQTTSPPPAGTVSPPSGCPSDSTTAVAGQEGHHPAQAQAQAQAQSQIQIQPRGSLAANNGSSGEPCAPSSGCPDQGQGRHAYLHLQTGFTSSPLPSSLPSTASPFADPTLSQASLNFTAAGPVMPLPPSSMAVSGGGGGGGNGDFYSYCLDRGDGLFTRLIPADMLPPLPGIDRLQYGCQGMLVLRDLPTTVPPIHPQAEAMAVVPRYVPPVRAAHPSGGRGGHRHPRKDKVYCDKWIHNGECAFTQQGCKFKHEMPHDGPLQRALGLFNGYPSWYPKAVAEGKVPIDMDNIPEQLMKDIENLGPEYVRRFALLVSKARGSNETWRQSASWRKQNEGNNRDGTLEHMTSSMNLGGANQPAQRPAGMFGRRPAAPFSVGYPITGRAMRGQPLAPGGTDTDFGPIAPPASTASVATALNVTGTGAGYSSFEGGGGNLE